MALTQRWIFQSNGAPPPPPQQLQQQPRFGQHAILPDGIPSSLLPDLLCDSLAPLGEEALELWADLTSSRGARLGGGTHHAARALPITSGGGGSGSMSRGGGNHPIARPPSPPLTNATNDGGDFFAHLGSLLGPEPSWLPPDAGGGAMSRGRRGGAGGPAKGGEPTSFAGIMERL